MNARIRRAATAVVASLAGLALLAGCANPLAPFVDGSGADEQRLPVTEGVAEELLPYYGQVLEWGSCDAPVTSEPVECATVTAPLDWSAPQSGDIELSISRSADGPDDPRGSLLINPGGPGASGIDMLHSSLEYGGFGEALVESFDIVGFDPRGVARSTPVACLDAQGMDSYLYDVPEGERGSSEWEKSQEASAQTFAEACEANTGEELEFITTEQSARDMDLLRAVLGDTTLDYLGYSYGTYLGATYAELFPDKVGRFVLDGALDPSVSGGEVGRVQVIAFEQSLRAYLQTCLDGSACPFRGSVDQAMDEVASLLASLDRRPLVAPDGRELGADTMMTAIVAALYSEENWPYLTEAFTGALEGDPSPALFLADFYNGREQGTYTSNSTEAFNAYNCMDYPTESDAQWERDKEILQEEAPVTWQYMTGAEVCEFWPYPPSGEREAIAADGAPPIVVIGTTGDPATPFAWAESLADQLSSGVLVAKEGEGHTAYQTGSSCIDDAVEGYLVDGTVPEDGLACQVD